MVTDKEHIAGLKASVKGLYWALGIGAGIFATALIGVGIWWGSELMSHTARLAALEEDVKNMDKTLDEIRLKQGSLAPTSPVSSSEAQEILSSAQLKAIKFSPAFVESAGLKFIDAGQNDSAAWGAAQKYLEYRSFLNADYQPTLNDMTPFSNPDYHFNLNLGHKGDPNQKTLAGQIYGVGKNNLATNDARLESLAGGIQVKGTGVEWIVIDGHSKLDKIVLDGEYMRNVVIRNANIEYDGGDLVLTNVYFVNCKFNFTVAPRSVDLSMTRPAFCTTASERVYITTSSDKDANGGS
jgi:hypothetical protein